ncbi:hypothetical protein SBD_5980 [Streptomyces bottropensis ATCC 25435]|uniref:Uncharacterized protein n=1 Tax=Streptomyces bottropensis ATCC 25435 TaxID=1054862 RepID=M3EUU0_9ACTN|nr:hypothetical protein SBD_5980 [Streptomyces bottropensis ATCC 25435]
MLPPIPLHITQQYVVTRLKRGSRKFRSFKQRTMLSKYFDHASDSWPYPRMGGVADN